jgi:ribonucleotide reductase beta subunit family protein with ferritin-like domain
MIEPILQGDESRFVIFPINPKYQDLWDLYMTHEAAFWRAGEIDYSADIDDWENKLNDDEQRFIKNVLAFFAASDGIVMENLSCNFADEVKISEARAFYAIQNAMENVHSLTYGLHIDTLIKDPAEKNKLFNAISEFPCIKKKADWAIRWMGSSEPFAIRLVAFAVVEGIFFSGSFCSIFWLKDKNKMVKGLGHSNELISRDEGLHVQFAVALFNHLETRPSETDVHELVRDAVCHEQEFICDAIPCSLIGMNKKLMSTYIEFVADRLCLQLGYRKIYKSENPFDFMDKIGMDGKTNFFEKRVSEYQMNHTAENLQFGDIADRDF